LQEDKTVGAYWPTTDLGSQLCVGETAVSSNWLVMGSTHSDSCGKERHHLLKSIWDVRVSCWHQTIPYCTWRRSLEGGRCHI